jgi:beta-phosphoglucomutase
VLRQRLNKAAHFFARGCIGFRVWFIAFFCGGASMFASADFYSNVQAVIFDCDGILVDTEHLKFLAWQEALASAGIEFSIEEYMPLVGHSSKNILQMIKQSKKIEISDEIIELKNAKYKTLQKQGVPAIQAMVDFARHLSVNKLKLGLVLGLASSAPKAEILTNLGQIGLENAFDLVISGSDDLDNYVDGEGKNKPKPYIYIEASKRLNILPEFCLVFEDTKAGVDAAADAGMIPIAVPNQFTLNHDFSKALRILSSHEELSIFWTSL